MSDPLAKAIAVNVTKGRQLLCRRAASRRKGDCVELHNRTTWNSRKGLTSDQLRRWGVAYQYAARTTRLRCLLYARGKASRYLRCVRKTLAGKRRFRTLDGNKFTWASFLIKRGLGKRRKSARRIIKKGARELCTRDRACRKSHGRKARRSTARLTRYQKGWWRLIYDFAIRMANLTCRHEVATKTKAAKIGSRRARRRFGRKAYAACAKQFRLGKTRKAFFKLLGRLYSWNKLLKVPASLKKLPNTRTRVASTPTRTPKRRVPYRSVPGIRVYRDGPSRPSAPRPAPRRTVRMVCDDKDCRTE